MNTSTNVLGMPMTPARYAKEWADTAEQLAAANNYKWMGEQLGVAQRVVEIGCGSGCSTLSLLERGSQLSVIEVNDEMLHIAKELLAKTGYAYETVATPLADSGAEVTANRLLHSNIFSNDVHSFCQQGSQDAIVCWLTGASPIHIALQLRKSESELTADDVSAYRVGVHTRCYELGRRWLRPQGVMHFVDRVGFNSWSEKDVLREELIEHHMELGGAAYSIAKQGTFLRRIDTLGASKIQYISQPNASNRVLALASIKAILL